MVGGAFTFLLKCLRSLQLRDGGERDRREPRLHGSRHGAVGTEGRPSRHHRAMISGSFPINALAQGLAPEEGGHMCG